MNPRLTHRDKEGASMSMHCDGVWFASANETPTQIYNKNLSGEEAAMLIQYYQHQPLGEIKEKHGRHVKMKGVSPSKLTV